MPLQATSGAASYDGFGGGVAVVPNYIEDVFSTWLYTGNGSTQTITNGIDLAGKGGMLWIKNRSSATNNIVNDTARGAGKNLMTNSTSAEFTNTDNVSALSSTGFSVGVDSNTNGTAGNLYASWTFRKQPKFFDVVTYTGTGSTGQTVSHNLGSEPGCIIVKRTDSTGNWVVYHRSLSYGNSILLNATAAQSFTNTDPVGGSTTQFLPYFVGGTGNATNTNGATYVAYLFAHNAGGFGLSGTDNVISCGSYNATGSGAVTINLGWEPQWVLVKRAVRTGGLEDAYPDGWSIFDNMRGIPANGTARNLRANLSNAEFDVGTPAFTATGMSMAGNWNTLSGGSSATYIYIAIRRGPMKVPTSGTSVFSPNQTSATTGTPITTGFPVDWQLLGINAGNVQNQRSSTRLTGVNTDGTSNSQYLVTSNTNAEAATGSLTLNWNNTGFQVPSLNSGSPTIFWNFGRAPSFFDEVCYTGTGSATTQAHNLGVAPELMIIKSRGTAGTNWAVYSRFTSTTYGYQTLQTDNAGLSGRAYGPGGSPNFEELSAAPTATVINLASSAESNANGRTFVAYLFATCAGVSKVGSYTGTGALQTVNCGFTGGARFVLIKRTDSTGDWYVYDSARGISASNDPYLLMNSTAAEVTGTNYVDTTSVGFQVTAAAPAGLNANGGSFVFLAIA